MLSRFIKPKNIVIKPAIYHISYRERVFEIITYYLEAIVRKPAYILWPSTPDHLRQFRIYFLMLRFSQLFISYTDKIIT